MSARDWQSQTGANRFVRHHQRMTCYIHSAGRRYLVVLWNNDVGTAVAHCAKDTLDEAYEAGDDLLGVGE